MRKTLLTLGALCATLLAPLALHTPLAQVAPTTVARVIVKYKADSALVRNKQGLALSVAQQVNPAEAMGRRMGLALRPGAGVGDRTHVVFASGMTSAQLAQRLAAESDVEYAVPDQRRRAHVAPNDSLYGAGLAYPGPAVGQWYLRAPDSTTKSAINAEAAWGITTGSADVVVAVLDSGVRFDHPDMKKLAAGGNLLDGYDMIADLDTSNDGDGRDADASDPGSWISQADVDSRKYSPACTVTEDSSWHGTQTAALIGALTDNASGMASVGRRVQVLPVRVLGKCGGWDSDIQAAMQWAAGIAVPGVPINTHPAWVINMSLGGVGACDTASTQYASIISAINARGTVVVASAGNDYGAAVNTPANCPGVIAVGGLRHAGTKADYSDLGPEVAISAPGGNCVNAFPNACTYPILTATNSGKTTPAASDYTSAYGNESIGTSFSAPLVAGTAALMLSADPTLTAAEVRALLQSSARAFPTGVGVGVCAAPSATEQDECTCTTSTCGAHARRRCRAAQGARPGRPGGQHQRVHAQPGHRRADRAQCRQHLAGAGGRQPLVPVGARRQGRHRQRLLERHHGLHGAHHTERRRTFHGQIDGAGQQRNVEHHRQRLCAFAGTAAGRQWRWRARRGLAGLAAGGSAGAAVGSTQDLRRTASRKTPGLSSAPSSRRARSPCPSLHCAVPPTA